MIKNEMNINQYFIRNLNFLALLWTLIVLLTVAVVQKPGALAYLPSLLAQLQGLRFTSIGLIYILQALLAGILVASHALALGLLAIMPLKLEGKGKILAAWLVGLGITGTLWFLIASIAVPPYWLAILLLILPLPIFLRSAPQFALPPLSRPVYIAVCTSLLISLLNALLPAYWWDDRFYHLLIPVEWLKNGQAVMWQQAPHFYFPHLVEGLFLPALILANDSAAKLQHWIFFPLCLALVWQLSAESKEQKQWALLLAASMPMLPLLSGWAYSDVALAAFVLGTFWSLEQWRTYGGRWLVIAGILAGFALGVKYIAFAVPLIALGLLLFWQERQLRHYISFIMASFLAGGTWYVRNLLMTGNPVYPFVLGGQSWDDFRATFYQMPGTGIGLNLIEWLKVPWLTTLGLRDANFYDGQMGPLFLALLPFSLFLLLYYSNLPKQRALPRHFGTLLIAATALIGVWMMGIAQSKSLWQSRFLLPPLLLLVPILAWGIAQFKDFNPPHIKLSRLIKAMIWLWVVIALVYAFINLLALRPIPFFVGSQDQDTWLIKYLGEHYVALTYLEELPPDARVLLLYEPRSLGARRPTQPDAILDQFAWRLHRSDGNLTEVARQLRLEGYTHLLLFRRGAELVTKINPTYHTPERLSLLNSFLAQEAIWRWTSHAGSYQLYEIKKLE